MTQLTARAFGVSYSAERAQYVVRRGTTEIIPTTYPQDPTAYTRAQHLCDALNRAYPPPSPAFESEPHGADLAEPCTACGHDEFSHVAGRCVGASLDGPCACAEYEP